MVGRGVHYIAALLAGFVVPGWSGSALAQSCPGQRDSFASTKVVGGTNAKLAHWPAQAVLRWKDPSQARVVYFCGGTAIASSWILTGSALLGRHQADQQRHLRQQ